MTDKTTRHPWSHGRVSSMDDPRVRSYFETMDPERERFIAALNDPYVEVVTALYTVGDLKEALKAANAPFNLQDSDRYGNPARTARAIRELHDARSEALARLKKVRDQLFLRGFPEPGEDAFAMQRRLVSE
jgi:hypothetical protein